MTDVFIVLILVLVVIVLLVLITLSRTLRRQSAELDLMCQRIDYLRRELDKLTSGDSSSPSIPMISRSIPPIAVDLSEHIPPPPIGDLERPEVEPPIAGGRTPAEDWIFPPPPGIPPQVPPLSPASDGDDAWGIPRDVLDEKASGTPGEDPTLADLLRRIRDWVMVDGEGRPSWAIAESAVALIRAVRMGAVFAGVVAILSVVWCAWRGYIGGQGQVAMVVAAGAGLIVGGLRQLKGEQGAVGRGAVGAGLLCFCFAGVAAGPFHGLLTPSEAFALMLLVTVAAGVMSIPARSPWIAAIGLLTAGTAWMLMPPSGTEARSWIPMLSLVAILMLLGALAYLHLGPPLRRFRREGGDEGGDAAPLPGMEPLADAREEAAGESRPTETTTVSPKGSDAGDEATKP